MPEIYATPWGFALEKWRVPVRTLARDEGPARLRIGWRRTSRPVLRNCDFHLVEGAGHYSLPIRYIRKFWPILLRLTFFRVHTAQARLKTSQWKIFRGRTHDQADHAANHSMRAVRRACPRARKRLGRGKIRPSSSRKYHHALEVLARDKNGARAT